MLCGPSSWSSDIQTEAFVEWLIETVGPIINRELAEQAMYSVERKRRRQVVEERPLPRAEPKSFPPPPPVYVQPPGAGPVYLDPNTGLPVQLVPLPVTPSAAADVTLAARAKKVRHLSSERDSYTDKHVYKAIWRHSRLPSKLRLLDNVWPQVT